MRTEKESDVFFEFFARKVQNGLEMQMSLARLVTFDMGLKVIKTCLSLAAGDFQEIPQMRPRARENWNFGKIRYGTKQSCWQHLQLVPT